MRERRKVPCIISSLFTCKKHVAITKDKKQTKARTIQVNEIVQLHAHIHGKVSKTIECRESSIIT